MQVSKDIFKGHNLVRVLLTSIINLVRLQRFFIFYSLTKLKNMTQFTINLTAFHNKADVVKAIDASVVKFYDSTDWVRNICGMGCCDKYPLDAAVTLKVKGSFSRNYLKKIFGKDAKVRGVKTS